MTIASAYRSPAYNATCPGAAPQSFHLHNLALDLVYDCPPAKVAEAAHALRNRGFFRGGIGKYPSFTHIDTRGKNADWG
ncbi:D-Ala-D-Ala carboxypeptidase family metallohydrolase [Verrucomicrobium spinosum]|uniref:D-Ala-D-Ala carboxypeptidase family metallohydrolase n=1 Tax=Verrucomicrobium spinosum TaxID=2736 RepID=UPI000946297E|nr:D-Ala-D-Ala carboxypeptidase family metallohydrolase [Verrucomicrobium spinosum]